MRERKLNFNLTIAESQLLLMLLQKSDYPMSKRLHRDLLKQVQNNGIIMSIRGVVPNAKILKEKSRKAKDLSPGPSETI